MLIQRATGPPEPLEENVNYQKAVKTMEAIMRGDQREVLMKLDLYIVLHILQRIH